MQNYTIYCTTEQTKKAIELGAPISKAVGMTDIVKEKYFADGKGNFIILPTAEQMIGFLRSKGIKFHFDDATSYWRVNNNSKLIRYGWCEQKELVAIDFALEYLTNNKR